MTTEHLHLAWAGLHELVDVEAFEGWPAEHSLASPTAEQLGSVALIDVDGMLPLSRWNQLAELIDDCATWPGVDSLLICLKSPAQQTAGHAAAVEAIRRASRTKYIAAYVDIAFGWAAALTRECHHVYASPIGWLGFARAGYPLCDGLSLDNWPAPRELSGDLVSTLTELVMRPLEPAHAKYLSRQKMHGEQLESRGVDQLADSAFAAAMRLNQHGARQ